MVGRIDPSSLFSGLEQQYGLPSGLLDSVWSAESSRGLKMKSPAGAQGHFQFMPATAEQYGVTDPNDLQQSAAGAARMFGDLQKQTGGDLPKTLAAYNWGIGNVQRKGLDAAPDETRNYIGKVMSRLGNAPAMSAGAAAMPQQQQDPEAAQPGYFRQAMSAIGNAIVPSAEAAEITVPMAAADDPNALADAIAQRVLARTLPKNAADASGQAQVQPAPAADNANAVADALAQRVLARTLPKTRDVFAETGTGGIASGVMNTGRGLFRGARDYLDTGANYLGRGIDALGGNTTALNNWGNDMARKVMSPESADRWFARGSVSDVNKQAEDEYQQAIKGSGMAGAARIGSDLAITAFTPMGAIGKAAGTAMNALRSGGVATNAAQAAARSWLGKAALGFGQKSAEMSANGAANALLTGVKTDDDSIAGTAATGAVLGRLGNHANDYLAPVFKPLVNRLDSVTRGLAETAVDKYNIPLGVGQMTGNKFIQTVESVLGQLPSTASRATEDAMKQRGAFNTAIGNHLELPNTTNFTPEIIEPHIAKLNAALGDAEAKLALPAAKGDKLFEDLSGLSAKANDGLVTADSRAKINTVLNDVTGLFDSNGGISGNRYAQIIQSIDDRLDGNNLPSENYYLQAMKNTINRAFRSENPAALDAWQSTRQLIKDAHIVRKNVESSPTGEVNPKTLASQVSANYSTQAHNPMSELAAIGRSALADKIPDSGTAARQMVTQLLTQGTLGGAGYGLGYAAGGNSESGVLGALVTGLAFPKAVQTGLLSDWMVNAAKKGLNGQSDGIAEPLFQFLLQNGQPSVLSRGLLSGWIQH